MAGMPNGSHTVTRGRVHFTGNHYGQPSKYWTRSLSRSRESA
jgi:hypothetical protein